MKKSIVDQALPPLGAPCRPHANSPLQLESVNCCICKTDDVEPLAVGEDFEYRTSPDTFLAVQCRQCGLVYLNPRPVLAELPRIYPSDYHAFEFSEANFGFVYGVRRRLEAKRLLSYCRGLQDHARILDVGCGDGFHLSLLKAFGNPTWQLEGVDSSELAAQAGTKSGLTIHHGRIQDLDLPQDAYDLAFLIATIEHVDDPVDILKIVRSHLRPGGRVILVTDNTDSLDFKFFKKRHWGGYHFPRHWNLFNAQTIHALAQATDLQVEVLTTLVSPVNWVYSIRNTLMDWNAPQWLINQFSLKSTISLGVFTIFDLLHQWAGRGALLRVVLRRVD